MSSLPALAAKLLLYKAVLMYNGRLPARKGHTIGKVQPIRVSDPAFKCPQLLEPLQHSEADRCVTAQSQLLKMVCMSVELTETEEMMTIMVLLLLLLFLLLLLLLLPPPGHSSNGVNVPLILLSYDASLISLLFALGNGQSAVPQRSIHREMASIPKYRPRPLIDPARRNARPPFAAATC
jgi:hypothetical protein